MALSRRGFLFSVAAVCAGETAGKGRTFPRVAASYPDPATEFQIVRLTDPQFSSFLPFSGNRVLTSRAMLYASDQTGRWEAFRMELKRGEARQLTEAGALDAASLALLPNERGFWHFDGDRLIETDLSKLKPRDAYRVPEGFEKTPGVSYSDDAQHAAFVEKKAAGGGISYRLRLLETQKESATTLVESPREIRDAQIRPKHTSLTYRIGDEVWMAEFDGQQNRKLDLGAGEIGHVQWAAGGHALIYLYRPADPHRLTTLREWIPEFAAAAAGKDSRPAARSDGDGVIAQTSQFVHFCPNADSSVFVGSSGSKASPYVLLLSRAVKREFTLAEHRASDAAMVAPLFAPNSQFVVFTSDRHGKPAIYWIAVDKFVAETEEG